MAVETLAWALPPAVTNAADGTQAYNMGIRFSVTESMPCVGVEWRVPDAVATPPLGEFVVALWQDVGNLRLARAAFVPVPGGPQQVLFSAPVQLETGLNYIVTVYTINYVYRASGNVYPSTPSGKLIADEGRLIAFNGGPDQTPGSYPASATGLIFYVSPVVGTVDGGSLPAAAPTGLAIPASLGQPATSRPGVAPGGLPGSVALGIPAVSLSRSAAPAGRPMTVALGQPSAGGAAATPTGQPIAIVLGTPTASLSRSAAPNGLSRPLSLGTPTTGAAPSRIVQRPSRGAVARPNAGTVTRP